MQFYEEFRMYLSKCTNMAYGITLSYDLFNIMMSYYIVRQRRRATVKKKLSRTYEILSRTYEIVALLRCRNIVLCRRGTQNSILYAYM